MFTRRTLLAFFGTAVTASPVLTVPVFAATEHPSVSYMNKVGSDLLNAHRRATTASFLRVVQRHSDVSSIADYALGDYGSKLPAAQKARYQRGVAVFMSRYLAAQSREYTIAKFEVLDAAVDDSKDVIVNTKVYLMNGQIFNVGWKLVWRGGAYRVRDARVLGFWLTNGLKSEITSFLGKRNGDFGLLIKALGS
jgi:phospholipid transport system substrate-binding protein